MFAAIKPLFSVLGEHSPSIHTVVDSVKNGGLKLYHLATAPNNAGTNDYQILSGLFKECSRISTLIARRVPAGVQQQFSLLPSEIRHRIYGQIFQLSGNPRTTDSNWGKHHAFDDSKRLAKAIKAYACNKFDSLDAEQRKSVCREIAFQHFKSTPTEAQLKWGMCHAKDDVGVLLNIFHASKALYDYEAALANKSSLYDLGRKKQLPRGAIGYINGMNTSKDKAMGNAIRFSKDVARGYNFSHCVHAATNGHKQDYHEVLLLRNGVITNPARLLHKTWDRFFDKSDSKAKFLQICFSKGASHVRTAIMSYNPERRKRITILAIAPSDFIPEQGLGLCHRVKHFVAKGDNVPYLLPGNAARIAKKGADIVMVPTKRNHHNPHSAGYIALVSKEVDRFLTRDCGINLHKKQPIA